jgi:thiol-disulfide isomerase/thioredoxin
MGRLSSLTLRTAIVCALVITSACNEEKVPTTAPQSRAAAVEAKPAAAAASVGTKPQAAEQAPRPILCGGQMGEKGSDLPSSALSRAGSPELPKNIEIGGAKWTWINFWAAWCVPCKEEIPRLRSWEKKLGTSLRLRFVSLDDDERQLNQFLSQQPADGVRSTYWLKDGKQREEWLSELGMDTDPELPAHVLVDPSGKVRCKLEGAVEDADYARVAELVGG